MIMFIHDALLAHLVDRFRSTLTYSDDLVGIDRQPASATSPAGRLRVQVDSSFTPTPCLV
jgi:hypothetical protein